MRAGVRRLAGAGASVGDRHNRDMARWAPALVAAIAAAVAGFALAACGSGGGGGSKKPTGFTLPRDAITLTGPTATVKP